MAEESRLRLSDVVEADRGVFRVRPCGSAQEMLFSPCDLGALPRRQDVVGYEEVGRGEGTLPVFLVDANRLIL